MNYDPAARTLSVWFVPSGNRYDYHDVPPQTYAAFRKASAKGRFFNVHSRPVQLPSGSSAQRF
nr:KTSC domain-containing protein [Mesorhizobium sp.]